MTDIDVMISLHCASMLKSANKLKAYLESRGITVWVCTQMSGGESYRDSIVDAIDRAGVVIIMLNNQWALSGECQDEYNYAKRLNLTSYESGRSERGQPRLPVFCPIAFSNLNWNAHKHVRLLSANTNFIVHDGDDLCADDAKVKKAFEGVASTLTSAGKVLKESTPDVVAQESAVTAAAGNSPDINNKMSRLEDSLLALTARVLELESKAPSSERICQPISSNEIPATVPPPEVDPLDQGPIQLGRNYLGNTLSEIQLYSQIKNDMFYGLQCYYSITLSNLVHDQTTGEVTFDARRSQEGIEWKESQQPHNLGQEVKDEFNTSPRVSFTGKGSGTFDQTQRRLIVQIPNWTTKTRGCVWGAESLLLAAITEGELVGFCSGNSTIVMKEF